MSSREPPEGQVTLWQVGQPHPYLPDHLVVEVQEESVLLEYTGDREFVLTAPHYQFPVTLPDWAKWLSEPLWDLLQAARLIYGISPCGITGSGPWPHEPRRLENLANKSIDAYRAGNLEELKPAPPIEAVKNPDGTWRKLDPGTVCPPNSDEKQEVRRVLPRDFLRWAKGRDCTIPPELLPLLPLLEQTSTEEPPGADTAEMVLFREGRWPRHEEDALDKALAAFSTDNRKSGRGFAITRAKPVDGAARRRWEVFKCPHKTTRMLPDGSLDPDGANPHAIIRSRDTPLGCRVDIQTRGWCSVPLDEYLSRLVSALKPDGLEVYNALTATVEENRTRLRELGISNPEKYGGLDFSQEAESTRQHNERLLAMSRSTDRRETAGGAEPSAGKGREGEPPERQRRTQPTQAECLLLIALVNSPMTLTADEWADKAGINEKAMRKARPWLEENGYIERVTDQKSGGVGITPAGTDLAQRIKAYQGRLPPG